MLIESIKLQNFRQFQNEFISFADGADGKNVTIILGMGPIVEILI